MSFIRQKFILVSGEYDFISFQFMPNTWINIFISSLKPVMAPFVPPYLMTLRSKDRKLNTPVPSGFQPSIPLHRGKSIHTYCVELRTATYRSHRITCCFILKVIATHQ